MNHCCPIAEGRVLGETHSQIRIAAVAYPLRAQSSSQSLSLFAIVPACTNAYCRYAWASESQIVAGNDPYRDCLSRPSTEELQQAVQLQRERERPIEWFTLAVNNYMLLIIGKVTRAL